jgi:hypothetical protein
MVKRQKVQDQGASAISEVVPLDIDSSLSPVAMIVNATGDPKVVALKKVVAAAATRKKADEDRSRLALKRLSDAK